MQMIAQLQSLLINITTHTLVQIMEIWHQMTCPQEFKILSEEWVEFKLIMVTKHQLHTLIIKDFWVNQKAKKTLTW